MIVFALTLQGRPSQQLRLDLLADQRHWKLPQGFGTSRWRRLPIAPVLPLVRCKLQSRLRFPLLQQYTQLFRLHIAIAQ